MRKSIDSTVWCACVEREFPSKITAQLLIYRFGGQRVVMGAWGSVCSLNPGLGAGRKHSTFSGCQESGSLLRCVAYRWQEIWEKGLKRRNPSGEESTDRRTAVLSVLCRRSKRQTEGVATSIQPSGHVGLAVSCPHCSKGGSGWHISSLKVTSWPQ